MYLQFSGYSISSAAVSPDSSMARICIFLMASRPARKSGLFSGSGWWTIPLYPSPVVRGLLV